MWVATRLGEMHESALRKRVDVFENADQRVEAVEYCMLDCPGAAHGTGRPATDAQGCFCPHHVHRSVHVTVKQAPEFTISGTLADFL